VDELPGFWPTLIPSLLLKFQNKSLSHSTQCLSARTADSYKKKWSQHGASYFPL
jgi:hypothetical protein